MDRYEILRGIKPPYVTESFDVTESSIGSYSNGPTVTFTNCSTLTTSSTDFLGYDSWSTSGDWPEKYPPKNEECISGVSGTTWVPDWGGTWSRKYKKDNDYLFKRKKK
jgi:hypothetical protein